MTLMKICVGTLLLFLFSPCFGKLGVDIVDVSKITPASTWECLKSNGYTFMIQRIWQDWGAPDNNAKTIIANAKEGGFTDIDLYMFPCRGDFPKEQARDVMKALEGIEYGTLWFDVESNPSDGCGWSSHSTLTNCDFVVESIKEL